MERSNDKSGHQTQYHVDCAATTSYFLFIEYQVDLRSYHVQDAILETTGQDEGIIIERTIISKQQSLNGMAIYVLY